MVNPCPGKKRFCVEVFRWQGYWRVEVGGGGWRHCYDKVIWTPRRFTTVHHTHRKLCVHFSNRRACRRARSVKDSKIFFKILIDFEHEARYRHDDMSLLLPHAVCLSRVQEPEENVEATWRGPT